MSQHTVEDPRIRLRPTKRLLKLIDSNQTELTSIPEHIVEVLKKNGFQLKADVEILDAATLNASKRPTVASKMLLDERTLPKSTETVSDKETAENTLAEGYLYLTDIRWLHGFLKQLREEKDSKIYLHELIEKCELKLPENPIVPRNPVLEKRCQDLRRQQQNREYRKMVKSVDASYKYYPEDSIAFQLKTLNSQMIAVLQFIFSVAAGFVFGFLGIQLIVGNLEFGFRLLLGIMFSLIIALAEIYFLAKKLNEYDDILEAPATQMTAPLSNPQFTNLGYPKKKAHSD